MLLSTTRQQGTLSVVCRPIFGRLIMDIVREIEDFGVCLTSPQQHIVTIINEIHNNQPGGQKSLCT